MVPKLFHQTHFTKIWSVKFSVIQHLHAPASSSYNYHPEKPVTSSLGSLLVVDFQHRHLQVFSKNIPKCANQKSARNVEMRFKVPYITSFPEIWIEKSPNLRFHMIWLEYEIKKSNQFWDTRLPMPVFIHHNVVKQQHDDPNYFTQSIGLEPCYPESMVSMRFERKSSWFGTFHHFFDIGLQKKAVSSLSQSRQSSRSCSISCWFAIARWYLPLPNQQVPLILKSPKWLQWFAMICNFCHGFLGHFHHYLKQTKNKCLAEKRDSNPFQIFFMTWFFPSKFWS